MAKNGFLLFICFSFSVLFNMNILYGATDGGRQVYIVYMGSLPEAEYSPSSFHQSMLQDVVRGSPIEDILVRSYKRSFNGFAAKLTHPERQKLASMKGVVSVFPSRIFQLHTTRSWDFIGFRESVARKSSSESDVIVGVIDSGIWPESESFNDQGFGPAPKKWKGACEGGENFTCNNKLIGARHYNLKSARDEEGHGTHTASTAAGNVVKDANFERLGQGTARGGVPSARIAAYKVCSLEGCSGADILSAFDDAIADGVDLITISIGSSVASQFTEDPISIGAFHAMAKGVLTLNSAGNSGPRAGSTSSVSPWMMSVAASTIDRLFIDKVVLGDGQTLLGYSINGFALNGKKPLVIGKEATTRCRPSETETCSAACLDRSLVEGKILVCNSIEGSIEARRVGAAGSILKNDRIDKVSSVVSLPAATISSDDYDRVILYINSTKKPQAEILKTEAIRDADAPVIADFSSRGPNSIIPEILKPDISAPGVDILAAYSPIVSPSQDEGDERRVKYDILSGTSMSCPHAAGVAAYVKSFHSTWSPSAIKSAIMTTAWPMNVSKNSDAEFAYGSGHINPLQAIDPGLIYEAFEEDYIRMLCGAGYKSELIRLITRDNSTSCPAGPDKDPPRDLNYPSMASVVSPEESFRIKFHRTVTNVGLANSTYKALVFPNSKISIKVVPEVLSFKSLNEKKSFDVTVTGGDIPDGTTVSSSLVWSDGKHSVRSPIVLNSKGVSGFSQKSN